MRMPPEALAASALIASVLVSGCTGDGQEEAPGTGAEAPETIDVTSSAIDEGAPIPTRFTCDGDDVSPPLSWSEPPEDARELVVVDDPDAPSGTFVHWVVAGIDPATNRLDEGGTPSGSVEGTNDFGRSGYGGPCPPQGDDPHRYRFVVHAMQDATGLTEGVAIDEMREVVAENALATGTLTAEYGRAG